MRWTEKLIKGRLIGEPWKHRDPAVRLRVVTESDDPLMLACLHEVAIKDYDPKVRLAALLRVDKEPLWLDRSMRDADEHVRITAEQQLPRLICQPADSEDRRQRRIAWLEQVASVHARQYVAEHAQDDATRRAALGLLATPGFLGDRVVAEDSDELALYALARIDQASTLERIAAQLRTRNKKRYQAVRRRLAEIGADAGRAVDAEALHLCKAMERLLRGETEGDRQTHLAALEVRWNNLPAAPDASLARRFTGAAGVIRQAIANPVPAVDARDHDAAELHALLEAEEPVGARQQLEHIVNRLDEDTRAELSGLIDRVRAHLTALDARPHALLTKLAAKIRAYDQSAGAQPQPERVSALVSAWDRAWNQVASPTAADDTLKNTVITTLAGLRERMQVVKPSRGPGIPTDTFLDTIEQRIANGELATAQANLLECKVAFVQMSRIDKWRFGSTKARMRKLFARLQEMRDWQRWSNDKVRLQLIREIEALPEAGLHPDAITAKLKEARQQWQQLDHLERLPGDEHPRTASAAYWRRFQSACSKAFEAAEPFLEKRKSIQDKKQQEVTDWLQQAETTAAEERPDPAALQRHLKHARMQIRRLDELPAAARRKMASRLRRLMDGLTQRLDAHRDEIEKLKQGLINEARQLEHERDHKAALEKAKALQKRWQAAGTTRRRKEQALWEAFRAPIDPLFEQATAKRREATDAEQQARAAAEALCREAEALAEATDTEPEHAAGRMAGLAQRWRQTGVRNPALRQRFSRAEEAVAQRLTQAAQAGIVAALDAVTRRCELIQQAWATCADGRTDKALANALRAAWPPAQAAFMADELEDRLEALLTAADTADPSWTDTGDNAQAARQTLIEMELLAGLPSPESERQARMDYQVRRLSQRLGGGERIALEDEIHTLIQRWQLCWPLPADDIGPLKTRYDEAIKILKESIIK